MDVFLLQNGPNRGSADIVPTAVEILYTVPQL